MPEHVYVDKNGRPLTVGLTAERRPVFDLPYSEASLVFQGGVAETLLMLPADVASFYVRGKYTDVPAPISLTVKLPGGTEVTVSEDAAAPTPGGAYSGQAAWFAVSGMDASAAAAGFSLRLYRG
ncbi:MAG: hypothetical protein LBW85_08515 [Deltaproteobacteria bacterium]|jgi:hypothetical protein|nr:hypothetical protein [Deltaproteobacteria bacterium]